jgi:hypothetical protein
MAIDAKTLGIVWAETARLVATDGSDAAKGRLQAVVGRLVDRARSLGSTANFSRPAPLPAIAPAPGGQQAELMRQAVETGISGGQFGGVVLPRRAVLWEVTPTGEPRESERPVPPWAQWIKQGTATRTSDFRIEGDRTGRIFRLYESDAEPGLNEVSFVSGFSSSGVPGSAARTSYLSLPWIGGGVATALFFWMVVTLAWTGQAVTQARDLMNGTPPEYAAMAAQRVLAACTAPAPQGTAAAAQATTFVVACDWNGVPDPANRTAAGVLQAMRGCLVVGNDAPPLRTSSFCRQAWRITAELSAGGEMSNLPSALRKLLAAVFGWSARPVGASASISIAVPMVSLMLSIALLGCALGYGMTRNVFGIWISPQNRISLARMQVSLWTIGVLGAFAALALFNIGELGEATRNFYLFDSASAEVPKTFPSIPAMVLATLGIATVSPIISALIKGTNAPSIDLRDDAQALDKSGIGRFIDSKASTNLEVRASATEASLVDLFTGETEADKDQIDISRLQNVVITFILVCGYAAKIQTLLIKCHITPHVTFSREERENRSQSSPTSPNKHPILVSMNRSCLSERIP